MKDIRKEYTRHHIHESDVQADPVTQFQNWFDDALQNQILEPTAMVLCTVGHDLKPSSRVVLLKNIHEGQFVFFTNYGSRKGRQLEQNPNASLLFFWDKMERQVRIEGIVSKLPESESDHYFSERPLLSQIGALVSPQSSRIRNREELTEKISYYEAHPEEVKRPQHWGGYALKPDYFEFWQGRESRLHDRIAYEMTDRGWEIFRLAP